MEEQIFKAIGERMAYATDAVLTPGSTFNGNKVRLHFELLNEQEETDFASMIEDFAYSARLGKLIDENEIVQRIETVSGNPVPDGTKELIESFRRNQHAVPIKHEHDPEQAATIVAVAGVAIAIAGTAIVVSKAADKIGDKIKDKVSDAAAFDPDGPPLGPDDGPIWPLNPKTGNPNTPFRPGQPGWTDPIPPDWEEQVTKIVVPNITSALTKSL